MPQSLCSSHIKLWKWFLNSIPGCCAVWKIILKKGLCNSLLLLCRLRQGNVGLAVVISQAKALWWFIVHSVCEVQLANSLFFCASTACWCFYFPAFNTLSQQASRITVILSLWHWLFIITLYLNVVLNSCVVKNADFTVAWKHRVFGLSLIIMIFVCNKVLNVKPQHLSCKICLLTSFMSYISASTENKTSWTSDSLHVIVYNWTQIWLFYVRFS